MSPEILLNLKCFAPEIVLCTFLVILFIVDATIPSSRSNEVPLILILVACVTGAAATNYANNPDWYRLFFSNLVANDPFSAFFRYLFLFACGVGAYLGFGSAELKDKSRMEFSLLLLCVTFGMSLMALATNLLVLYIGIETVSIVSFVMAGFSRDSLKSNEASFKYLVFGALASGLMLYGFSLLYGYTGSLQYHAIGKFLVEHQGDAGAPMVLTLALTLVYTGLAYKISAFPMHFWTPDVYEGSPTPVAAFFSVGPKAAGFAALVRIFKDCLWVPAGDGAWQLSAGSPLLTAVAIAAALTMTIGNLSAIGQRNVKRLLAYSSIAHVGYMLMGLVALNTFGLSAILFYLVAYCAMNLGAFWVVSVVSDFKKGEELEHFKGIGWQMPTLGVCMAIFLFSLTGIPMFAGFVGKFLLFATVLNTPGFLWLAVLGVLNSVVSLYYYSKILKSMWLDRPDDTAPVLTLPYPQAVGLIGLAIPTVILGLFFGPVIQFTEMSLRLIL